MIFVTAGTQLPFDRLLKAIDQMAEEFVDVKFVVQALNTTYTAKNIKVLDFLSPGDFDHYIDSAKLIISHAGMGTIINAMVKQKPIVVMPRLFKYNEHRNDHQLATAKKMDSMSYVDVAYDEIELVNKVRDMWPNNLRPRNTIGPLAPDDIVKSINTFIKY
jgi:UDP-N-acetylglucosamine transferase subunit ALG13